MKKLSVSKALIGLFVVLAVGIGLAACYDGTYTGSSDGEKIVLESGNKYTATYYAQTSDGYKLFTEKGSYKIGTFIFGFADITFTKDSISPAASTMYSSSDRNGLVSGIFNSNTNTISGTNVGNSSNFEKKSADGTGAVFEVELDGLSAEELEELGL
ncbi:hypothetical protein AGMMS49579_27150 [Spirochaetia bacterium]|nr:hypothetical protein AGMMS49579_27150 [Spirochaetia bacterium]